MFEAAEGCEVLPYYCDVLPWGQSFFLTNHDELLYMHHHGKRPARSLDSEDLISRFGTAVITADLGAAFLLQR
ncbi:hypothetical protein LshimejAT787_0904160 [Lyophyllum shimeji]|uniref:Uncharacterized protein n=1 Tax=Lyophyllum shimeji TaxID=47721 RepID=A0A9P3USH7_LYOSH|nr:hypothetical protein LshimejAT787_0904160 [Lyophyllum shimeji]